MRELKDIKNDINNVKVELKEVQKEFGTISHEYVDVALRLDGLIEEYEFTELY